MFAALFASAFLFLSAPEDDDEFAAIESQELKANNDSEMPYFLIGAKKRKTPAKGFRLLVVLPGGDGSADFNSFVRRIHVNALSPEYLLVQLISPPWKTDACTWPSSANRVPKMKFTTEEYFEAVVKEVMKNNRIDPSFVFTMGWSSGGPPSYLLSVQKKKIVTGSYIAQSVFHAAELGSLKNAKDHAYFIDHSPEDKRCPFRLAEEARDTLTKAGAKVAFETYKGGHGWQDMPYQRMQKGIRWLEKNHAEPVK